MNGQVASGGDWPIGEQHPEQQTENTEREYPVSDEYEARIAGLQAAVTQQGGAIAWLQGQRDVWERAAREHESTIAELRAYAQQQQDTLTWLEGQRASWEHAAHANELIIAELQAQVRRLEQFVQRMTSSAGS